MRARDAAVMAVSEPAKKAENIMRTNVTPIEKIRSDPESSWAGIRASSMGFNFSWVMSLARAQPEAAF